MSKLDEGTDEDDLQKSLSQGTAMFGSFNKYSGIIGFEGLASRQANLRRRQILKTSKLMINAEPHLSSPPLLITKMSSTEPDIGMAATEHSNWAD